MKRSLTICSCVLFACAAVSCSDRSSTIASRWDGQIDSLPDGRVSIRNGDRGIWPEAAGWRVTQDLRIGSVDEEGPESFGDITSLAVDPLGQIWVLDRLSSDLRVFDREGRHLRTIGRTGSGPGEFKEPVHVDVAPDGRIWVMDPQNARLSVFDSAGDYLEAIRVPGGLYMLPWPGGFDTAGFYYGPAVRFEPEFRIDLVRFDQAFRAVDTLRTPTDPIERDEFTIVSDGQVLTDEPVPFQGGLAWRLSRSGTIWALVTDQYRLFELDRYADTLRVVTKAFSPVPVTDRETAEALAELQGFVEQGGKVDVARIPGHKPPVRSFFVADGHLWVERATIHGAKDVTFDIFNPRGQYMGAVAVPFRLQLYPSPIVRDDMLYGVARDEMDVQYVVRARIEKPRDEMR